MTVPLWCLVAFVWWTIALAIVYLLARVTQSTIHLAGRPGNLRFVFLMVQLICLLGLAAAAIRG